MSVDNFEKYIHKQVVQAQYVRVMDFYHEQALNMCVPSLNQTAPLPPSLIKVCSISTHTSSCIISCKQN